MKRKHDLNENQLNTNRLMNTAINRMAMVAVAMTALVARDGVAADGADTSWRGQPGSTHQEWRFDTGANPLTAEVCNAGAPHTATMTPGQFALGWRSQLPGLGDASGYWDMGSSGRITTPLPSLVSEAGTSVRYILVSVCQYQDGGIYGELAAVSIPGATYVRTGVDFTAIGAVGEWQVNQTLWRVEAGESAGQVTVTGAANGSIVDQVVIEAGIPVSAPPLLAVRALGAVVEIAWAASLQGFVLESNSDLDDAQGWQGVNAVPQVVGDEQRVQVPAGGSGVFFRLRKP
jgi:hypothetical protein